MNFKSYREIILSYANSHGKGLPLTAEEYCNAMALYIQEVLPEYQNETLAYIKDQIENGGLVDSYIASVVNANTADIIVSWADNNFNNYVKAFFEDENEWFGIYLNTKAYNGDLDTMFGYGLASSGAIHGSDTIVVDTTENGDGVEIHLDSEIVSKIERSVKTPLTNPSEPQLPVLGVNGATEWEPVSGFIGGGSGTMLYLHKINFEQAQVGPSVFSQAMRIISTKETPYTSLNREELLKAVNIWIIGQFSSGEYSWCSVRSLTSNTIEIHSPNATTTGNILYSSINTNMSDDVTPY